MPRLVYMKASEGRDPKAEHRSQVVHVAHIHFGNLAEHTVVNLFRNLRRHVASVPADSGPSTLVPEKGEWPGAGPALLQQLPGLPSSPEEVELTSQAAKELARLPRPQR